MEEIELLKEKLSDQMRRLTSWKIYKIKNKDWNVIPFIPNKYQIDFLKNKHKKNIILKARQLWFSTIIQLYALDCVIFYNNFSAWVIAQWLHESKSIFENKVKFAYENLPDRIKRFKEKDTDSKDTIKIENWSSMYVSSSFRSGTLQYLHISEYWKICAKFPEKAREINTGAIEAVSAENEVVIESTAEWKTGDFYDKVQRAYKLQKTGKPLNNEEYKLFFYPRWEAEEYIIDDEYLTLTSDTISYFDKLEIDHWIVCTDWQKKRWQTKKEKLQEDMYREYPSFIEEAFFVSSEWSYYWKRVNKVYEEQRVCKVPYDPRLPLYTSWDLWWTGWGDNMDVWFFQIYGKEIRLVDWFTWVWFSIEDVHYNILKDKPYKYDTMFFPHDGNVQSMKDHQTRADMLEALWYKVVVLENFPGALSARRSLVRDHFWYCWFDEEKCWRPLDILKEYKKKWNDSTWEFIELEEKNTARHTADSFGYWLRAIVEKLWFGKIEKNDSNRDQHKNNSLSSRR